MAGGQGDNAFSIPIEDRMRQDEESVGTFRRHRGERTFVVTVPDHDEDGLDGQRSSCRFRLRHLRC